MVHYRRARVPGGTFFFTVALRNRRAETLTKYIHLLTAVLRDARARRPFQVDACVVLPDHLHTIWTLPLNDTDYSGRWRWIKAAFVRGLCADGAAVSSNAKGECDVWQRRFWEHQIRDENDLARHVDYVHFNPVKHGLVQRVVDWPWSSFHRHVRSGVLPVEWGSSGEISGEHMVNESRIALRFIRATLLYVYSLICMALAAFNGYEAGRKSGAKKGDGEP
jgi:putative transposase